MRLRRRVVPFGVAVVSVLALASFMSRDAVLRAQGTFEVIASGLDNPRGLAFGPEGALYVAEAGRGGEGPCQVLRGVLHCYGPSGAITRLWRGTQERIATGLPSYVNTTNGEAGGPVDVSFQGRGGAYVTVGLGADPAVRAAFGPAGHLFGTLIQVPASGRWRFVADIAAHEASENPAGGPVDSNPYGILAEPGARIVADAGANALLHVAANGDISTLAVFPRVPAPPPAGSTDPVPTEVVAGPDGAYYVSQLTGAPFSAGAAQIYRVVPGGPPEVFLSGFKTVIDLDFGPDGSLYVLQHATGPFLSGPGKIIRVEPDGTRTDFAPSVLLTRPTSILVSEDGAIYVSNFGTSIGTGEVLRIEP